MRLARIKLLPSPLATPHGYLYDLKILASHVGATLDRKKSAITPVF